MHKRLSFAKKFAIVIILGIFSDPSYSWAWMFKPGGSGSSGGKAWTFSLGASASSLKYQQSSLSQFSELMLTPQFKVEAMTKGGHFNLAMESYYHALALSADPTGNKIQYLSGELKLGYFFRSSSSAIGLNFLLGAYYLTSIFEPGNLYGFQNLIGPVVSPILRFATSKGRQFWLFFKYAQLLDGKGSTFSNSNLTAGGGFTLIRFSDKSHLNIVFDAAKLFYNYDTDKSLQSNSYSIGTAVTF